MTSSNPKFWPPPNLPAECREQHAATKSSRIHSRRRPNRDPVSIPVVGRPPPATPLLCASKSPPPCRAPTVDVRTSNPYRARAALPLLLCSAPPHRRLPPTPVLPPFSPATLLLLLCSARSLHVPPTPTVHTRRPPPASSTPTLPLVGVSELVFFLLLCELV
ncbi:unnamed protein product [Linum trigynum]|uniref:Uncharacterized protein n=1 Tax=Linum trigynum TaxID=586398 RepID=A0AAV2E6U4_9ROSI